MPMTAGSCHHRFLAAVAGVLLLVAGCSGGSSKSDNKSNSAGSDATSASDTASAAPTNPYPGYQSVSYDGTQHWICHPDLASDECAPQPETVIDADGTVHERPAPKTGDRKIDCFYVYPTVSSDPGANSDLQPDEAELATVRAQVARYSSVCRVFAPAYRQITIAGLFGGATPNTDSRAVAYGDVVDAWKTYMAQDNHGRGVVLIGHSQGTGHLIALMRDEIDPKPEVRNRVVSAILMGGTVGVPPGKLVGGDFRHLPGCTSAVQTGCVITFSSFPEAEPPGPGAIFGRDPKPGQQALCVNPAALAGGDRLADTMVPRKGPLIAGGTAEGLAGTAPYVVLPKTLKAQCARVADHDVLLYAPAQPDDKRDVAKLLQERLGPAWGLHLNDANLPQDDLIEIVGRQAKTWVASH